MARREKGFWWMRFRPSDDRWSIVWVDDDGVVWGFGSDIEFASFEIAKFSWGPYLGTNPNDIANKRESACDRRDWDAADAVED